MVCKGSRAWSAFKEPRARLVYKDQLVRPAHWEHLVFRASKARQVPRVCRDRLVDKDLMVTQ
jgi:hypothetical protein